MKDIQEYDATSILEKATFDELYSIESVFDRTVRTEALKERAFEIGDNCGKSFNKLLKAYDTDWKEKQKKGSNQLDLKTRFGYFEDGHELKCGSWIADENGVFRYNKDGMNELACYNPILITRIFKNAETKKQKVELAYKIAGEWFTTVVDKGVIAASSKITALAEYGVHATSENAKLLVKYLADIEAANVDTIERRISTGKFGWIGDDFIPYGMNVEFDNKEKFPELFASVAEKGSYSNWLTCVKTIRASGRKEPLVYMAASFASILLCKLDMLSFVVNLWEETGRGKTVSMMVAASIWGDPKIGRFMTDASSTETSFEVKSDVLNHLPLMIDDLSKVREIYKDNFQELIYSWSSGKGKDRSDQNLGQRKSSTWNNITITSYERPLATEKMKGGAINRVLDFQIEPGSIFTKETGRATVNVIGCNYGFAGRMFVDTVKKTGIKQIKEIQAEFLKRIDDYCTEISADKEDKQKLPLSVLLTADKLATDNIFQDGVYLDFEWCVGQLKNKDEISEGQRAYQAIMDEISIHINTFVPDADNKYKGEVWGFRSNGYVYIIPGVLAQIAERNNFSMEQFTAWAKERDLLLHDKGKSRKTARFPGEKRTQKFVALKEPEEEKETETDKEGFQPVDEQIELPFD